MSIVIATQGQVSITGTTNETNLAALRIPAGSMGKNGAVQVVTLWSYTNSSNNKTLLVRFGPQGSTSGALPGITSVATTTASAQLMALLRNNNATNSQNAFANQLAPFGAIVSGLVAASVDTTADFWVDINGTLAVGTETLTLVHAYAVVFPAP